MKKLPVIYKRTNTGATQQWQIVVDGNGFYTVEGQLNGKLTTSMPTVCSPKNEGKGNATTGEEQAYKEAQAKWTKKIEKGYTEDITKIDTSKKYFEPMLCKVYDDYKSDIDFTKKVYVQPKLDGMRCICRADGMWTRNGKPIVSAPHIFEALKPIFAENPQVVLDGELYADKFKYDFNSIISLCKKSKPTEEDLLNSAISIEYWIYDFPSCDDKFSRRTSELKYLLGRHKVPTCIKFVDTYQVESFAKMDKLFEEFIENGYEGEIIRLDALYENKRSKSILKRKEFKDDEYVVTGYAEGTGNRTGTLGYVTCVTKEGKAFRSNIKGTFEYLIQLWKDRESLVGKIVTIKYFNLTPDGVPRFPYVIGVRDYE